MLEVLTLAIEKLSTPERRGTRDALAAALGISGPAISSWTRIPAERVLEIERLTGVHRHELRPDLYPDPPAEAAE